MVVRNAAIVTDTSSGEYLLERCDNIDYLTWIFHETARDYFGSQFRQKSTYNSAISTKYDIRLFTIQISRHQVNIESFRRMNKPKTEYVLQFMMNWTSIRHSS
jgi:hypothetical protein